jgi:hypothetical protein
MRIIDHGEWVEYTPIEPPPDVPRGALFACRKKDGMDWYKYISGKNFGVDTVKFALDIRNGQIVIRVPVVEADRLFPIGCRVIEIADLKRKQNEVELIKEFANRFFDLKTGRIGELWQPQQPEDKLTPLLNEILERLDKLEKRK